jgi:hypothetical protein
MLHDRTLPLPRTASGTAPRFGADLIACGFLGLTAALWSFLSGGQIGAWINDYRYLDLWFQGDAPRVFGNMTNLIANPWSRDYLHPLFRLTIYPLTAFVRAAFSTSPELAVRLVVSASSAVWVMSFYGLLRIVGLRWREATLYALVLASSAAFMFWGGLPETFLFGSLSLILTLALVGASERQSRSPLWFVACNLLAIGFVVTNLLASLLATFLRHPWRRALGIMIGSAILLLLAWGVHVAFFPVDLTRGDEFLLPQAGGPWQVLPSILCHSLVMPEIKLLGIGGLGTLHLDWRLTTQFSAPGSGGFWSALALGAWLGMLGLGTWSCWRFKGHVALRLILGLTTLGFLAFHLIFGDETFLYSLEFVPLLVLIAAFAVLGPWRRLGLALAAVFVLSSGINNFVSFDKASRYVRSHDGRPEAPSPMGFTAVVFEGRDTLAYPADGEAARREVIQPDNMRIRLGLRELRQIPLRLFGHPSTSPPSSPHGDRPHAAD